ncbi:MAG: hypothetical protein JSW50_00815 [Candidatus Latescibacterota bacterium]|nr:MAG: hypothetical protein JSW50_00815 [Candidatus Latescibacterota bacterium]
MKINGLFSPLVLLLLALASCASDDDGKNSNESQSADHLAMKGADASNTGLETVRGHYVFGHEVRSFKPCGKDEAIWVIDSTGLLKTLYAELAPKTQPYAEIFVVANGRIGPPPADGFGADYPGSLSIVKVTYATFEGFGCDFDWNNFTYRAQGNEPFWMVDILRDELRLARPGSDDQTWTHVKKDKTDDAVIFHAIAENQSTIQLVIESKPGRDSMSGAYYGLSARLILDGESYTGYAIQGTGPVGE